MIRRTTTFAMWLAIAAGLCAPVLASDPADGIAVLRTQYARLVIDHHGRATSLTALASKTEYSPAGHSSAVMSLHEFGRPNEQLIAPTSATFDAHTHRITLTYPNGATAVVSVTAQDKYFRFQLISLTPRGDVDNIVWGPLNTTIHGRIGDLIGVVRSDDWAIGMFGLDDNTIAGPPADSDCYQMGYYVHSVDPKKDPLPAKYHDGQRFAVGGNGVSDTAFFSHPEAYFQYVAGNGAKLEPAFGSSVAYHARDRRRVYTYEWSLLPGFERSRPRHMVTDPVDVDYVGSAVAIYACPDDQALHVIESIVVHEGLPHIVIDGQWIRDPASFRPTLYWRGPYDKCIEYAKAMGLRTVSRDTGEFYPCLGNNWTGGGAGFSDHHSMTGPQYMQQVHAAGLSHYGGLHTLTVFLQGGISHDVTPVPSEHLQTVCRTHLAHDISATDTNIVVTDPSFLGEKGTWTWGDDSNYLRIGGEMLRYSGITDKPPYTLLGVQRGHASKPTPHKAGDVVAKLMQNCYNGFVPDMTLLPKYADYYADLMSRNGLECLDFDGLESLIYQNQGYYAVRIFFRRLFDRYARLTGGKRPRITGSNVFAGGWLYMDVCNLGSGNRMFDPVANRWGIEGKDIRTGFGNSYYPATFGIQGWHSDWSLYDAENLEAKSVGWDATYALSTSQAAIENTGGKDAILKALHAWEAARDAGVFTPAIKANLRDMDFKAHLVQTGDDAFMLYRVEEQHQRAIVGNVATTIPLTNDQQAQPLQFALRFEAPVDRCVMTLPDGTRLAANHPIARGQFILCKGGRACIADANRRPIVDLPLPRPSALAHGDSMLSVQFPGEAKARQHVDLTAWILDAGRVIAR